MTPPTAPRPTLGLNLPYVEGSMDVATPRWADLGITHLQVQLRPNPPAAVEALRPVVEAIGS